MARYCDVCSEQASRIGSFTNRLGQKETRAACTFSHMYRLIAALKDEGYAAEWRPIKTEQEEKPSGKQSVGDGIDPQQRVKDYTRGVAREAESRRHQPRQDGD